MEIKIIDDCEINLKFKVYGNDHLRHIKIFLSNSKKKILFEDFNHEYESNEKDIYLKIKLPKKSNIVRYYNQNKFIIEYDNEHIINFDWDYFPVNEHGFKYVKNQTNEIIDYCLFRQSYDIFRYIKNPSNDIIWRVLKDNPYQLKYVKEQTLEMCEYCVDRKEDSLEYAKIQTEDMCIKSVKECFEHNWRNLKYVKEQTYKICKEALKTNSKAIRYVKSEFQTKELCLLAIRNQNYLSGLLYKPVIAYIKQKNLNEEICLESLRQDPMSIKYIKNKTKRICLEIVEKYPYLIEYVDQTFLSEEMIMNILKEAPIYIRYIRNRTNDMYILVLEKDKSLIKFLTAKDRNETLYNYLINNIYVNECDRNDLNFYWGI